MTQLEYIPYSVAIFPDVVVAETSPTPCDDEDADCIVVERTDGPKEMDCITLSSDDEQSGILVTASHLPPKLCHGYYKWDFFNEGR